MGMNEAARRGAPRALAALIVLAILSLAAPAALSAPAAAPPAPAGRRAVLIVLDGVGLPDLAGANLPNFRRLLVRRGALAAANVRPAGPYLPESGYISLGAGTRAYGSPSAGLVLAVDELYEGEPAGVIFERNTGFVPPPNGLVSLDLPQLLTLNADADHPVTVGALGQALRDAGLRVALLGQADAPGVVSRPAGWIAMDERGVIPTGQVGAELSRPDPRFPTGRRTAYDRLLAAFHSAYARADLVVIETGDTARLNRSLGWLTADQAVRMRRRALQRFDGFLGRLSQAVDWERTLVVVTSPGPSGDAVAAGRLLTFVAAFGPDVRPGLLTSPTTRRPGLVTGADVAPTILSWLGAPAPATLTGRPLVSYPFADPLPALLDFERRAVATYQQRPPVLKGYVVLQIVFILGTLVALFLVRRLPRAVATVLRVGLAGLTAVPLALLLLPLLRTGTLPVDVLLLVLLTLALVLVARLTGRSLPGAFLLLYLGTSAALLTDLLLGSRLGRVSFLGYDPIGGARFYGLGNEYMGVLLGATVAGCAALLDRFPGLRARWRLVVLFPLALATFLTGLTAFGANFGGFLGGVVTLLAAWLAFRERRFRLAHLSVLAGVAVLLVVGIVVVDALRPGTETSHLGLLARQIAASGPGPLYAVAARKLAMNFRLMRYTPWADGLVTFIVGLGILLYRPVGLLQQVVQANPAFTRGFWAALAGTAAVFFLNDSGVVAAATFMLFPTAYLLDLALQTAFSGRQS